jgi:hypothetical protein
LHGKHKNLGNRITTVPNTVIYLITDQRMWKPPALAQIIGKDLESHRKFFDKLATDMSFDPLVPDGWYLLNAADVVAKGVCW